VIIQKKVVVLLDTGQYENYSLPSQEIEVRDCATYLYFLVLDAYFFSGKGVADEMIKRGIVESISPRHVGRLLAKADIKPQASSY
jgi:hypothetical protein